LDRALGIPLVIHGGTGLTDDQFRRLVDHGVTKINYYTALADAAGARIRLNAIAIQGGIHRADPGVAELSPRRSSAASGCGVARAVPTSPGRLRPWRTVEHVSSSIRPARVPTGWER